MNTLFYIVLPIILGIQFSKDVLGDYDITTVYKFNVEEESDIDGDTLTKYLNTCSVTVHPQTNAIGLPFISRHSSEIVYPLASPTIPTLESPYENSQWSTLNIDGTRTSAPLQTSTLSDTLLFSTYSYRTENIVSLLKDKSIIVQNISAENSGNTNFLESYGYKYITEFYIGSFTTETIFLFVQVRKNETKDFAFNIYLRDGYNNGYRNTITVRIYQGSKTMTIQPSWITKLNTWNYQDDETNQLSIYIGLTSFKKGKPHLNAVTLFDEIGNTMYVTGINTSSFQYGLDFLTLRQESYYKTPILYNFRQLQNKVLTKDSRIASKWTQNMKNNSTLFMTYYRKAGAAVVAHIQEYGSNNTMQLDLEEQNVTKFLNYTQDNIEEIVLTKIHIMYPENWTKEKRIYIKSDKDAYIKDIWEGADIETYKIDDSKICVKSDIRDIYDVVLKGPRVNTNPISCVNGGFFGQYNESCICPPGFTGDSCEISCGRNNYGHKCSKMCSTTSNECKGLILCTPSYGCSCAPGYQGDKCLQPCEEGTYGADCKQTCGQCKGGCDMYTGDCRKCYSPYLVWPKCKEHHSFWKEHPRVVSLTFTSIKLSLNFSMPNIEKSSDITRFYMGQYKEDGETLWNNGSYEVFSPMITEYEVDSLKPGLKYFFRVLLIDESLRNNDPDMAKISESLTKCSVSEIKHNINVTRVTNESITISWNKEKPETSSVECPFTSYILDIKELLDLSMEHRKINILKRNSFVIKSLSPSHTYNINLKKMTVHGESIPVSSINVSTEETAENTLGVSGIMMKIKDPGVYLEWFKSPIYKIYYIKYKLIRRLSCAQDKIESLLQVVTTTFTNYTLSLEPNAQYEVFVTGNQYQENFLYTRTVTTFGKIPDVSPTFYKKNIKVTNESAYLYWTDPVSYCISLNGFFEKYVIELLDIQSTVLYTYNSKNTSIEINQLRPETKYKVRIRYLNHVGLSPQIYDQKEFSTKSTSFIVAQDLTAYKVSANMIGIRWKISDTNSTVTGVNIKIQNHAMSKSMNITNLTSLPCKAWSSYFCYKITNLKQNTKYLVSVDIFSTDFPEGGSQQSIQAVTRETAPSPVTDIKVIDISKTNVTVSWRIPFLLNGILRKFQVQVEHLSSFDESLCCQTISTVNYAVTEEKENYYHVIENVQNASSYQITIRAFTKRLGQEATKIIDIPAVIPFKQKPRVTINDEEVVWDIEETVDNNTTLSDLVSDTLVIVQSEDDTYNTNESLSIRNELSSILRTNDWWLAYVCPGNDICSVKIGAEEKRTTSYGEIQNRPLLEGQNYMIVLIQVNKSLSAKSYTIAKSAKINIKDGKTTTNKIATQIPLDNSPKKSIADDTDTKTTEPTIEDGEDNFETGDLEEPVNQDDVEQNEENDTENREEEGTEPELD